MCAARKRAASLDGVGSPDRGKLANPAISKKRCFNTIQDVFVKRSELILVCNHTTLVVMQDLKCKKGLITD
jgi:hypothetical protein